jgi:murein DD-endopeptidase MepM/ murein hydrolase activator NlpD
MRHFFACLVLLALIPATAPAQNGELRITTLPGRVLVDRGEHDQRLNFDFIVENPTATKLELASIEVSAYARAGALVSQRRVGNGAGVDTIANRTVEPGGRLVVFNPFQTFAPDLELARLRYDFAFDAGEGKPKVTVTTTIEPAVYRSKTDLILPVGGRVISWDGPDLYGHHRRIDITGGMTTALGITTNFMRYAYDFSVVDEQGRMFKGTGERNEDWYGFGTPIYATGDGTVALAGDGIPDNTTTKRHELTRDQVMKDPHVLFGNHVVVDHGNGEVSFFAHLKQGSVRVKPGEKVRQGQVIGEMGFSGDAITVHLHYQLQSDTKWGEGLPAHFRGLKRWVGDRAVPLRSGFVDSGDVVESTLTPRR